MQIARRLRPLAAILAASLVTIPACGTPAHAAEAVVFAAASLRNALTDIAAAWKADTGNSATISFAGSSALARQIEAGAPADVFVSANTEWMDELAKKGLVVDGTARDLLGNSLVLVAHGQDAKKVEIAQGFDLARLIGDGHLAMAMVNAVPAGIYGKAALTSLGVWDSVKPKVAEAENVRAALALVARGEAPYGIVYATDAVAEPDVSVVGTFPEDSHKPIVYPAAEIKGAPDPAAAKAFLEYLGTPTARRLFEKQGFTVLAK